ncbi:MAG: sulfatase-like hydrolase/transferase [Candidatus Bathyarchaeota archaeon]|nr:sulfatase-like hydrolase/transferase [Candidatus Bathyarchaeota archaeon]
MNVTLMLLDALRYDHVTSEITPNLMKIAKAGVFFSNAFSCNSSTIKSLPCILSAQLDYDPEKNIASILSSHGFHTAMIHSNPMVHSFYPGFKETLDLKSNQLRVSKKWKKALRDNLPPQLISKMKEIRAKMQEEDKYLPYSRSDETFLFSKRWMSEQTQDYFLWLHLMEPHIPYYPKETSLGISKLEMRGLNDKIIESVHGNTELTFEEVETAKTLYKEDINEMDHEIGQFIIDFNHEEDLLIITSDHGEEFGEHGQFSHHQDKIIPELVHIPLIFYGKDVKHGVIRDEYVSTLSIAPTILEALGLNQYKEIGKSIWNELTN